MHKSQYQVSTQDVSCTVDSRNHALPLNVMILDIIMPKISTFVYLVRQFLLVRAKISGIFMSPFTMDIAMSLVSQRDMDGFE